MSGHANSCAARDLGTHQGADRHSPACPCSSCLGKLAAPHCARREALPLRLRAKGTNMSEQTFPALWPKMRPDIARLEALECTLAPATPT